MTTRKELLLLNQLSRRQAMLVMGAAAGTTLVGCAAETSDEATTEEEAPAPAAAAPSGVQPAPSMPAPKYAQTNGIRMGYYEAGEGLPVVFCHGFPELAYSWRNQVGAFSEAGYRAIAPDQRGYGLTDRPEGMENYTLKHLCDDMAGLLDSLEIDKAVFCGHDWGGGVVWFMPRIHPDRVLGVIGVNTPTSHPQHPRENTDSLIVQSDRFYQRTFQPPGEAEAVLSADVEKSFQFMLRKGGIWNVEDFKALPEDSLERHMDLLGLIERGDFTGEQLLSDQEMQYFVDTFEVTGFTGGLNWYRASAQLQTDFGELAWDIEVPCLYIGAENDVILRPSSADGMEEFIPDLEKYTVADCGHWTQQEKPEELNRVALDWLGRKFA